MTPAVRGFVALVLVAVGALMAELCGLCTLFYGGVSLLTLLSGSMSEYDYMAQAIGLFALLLGVLPTALGAWMLWLGLRLARPRPPPSSPPSP